MEPFRHVILWAVNPLPKDEAGKLHRIAPPFIAAAVKCIIPQTATGRDRAKGFSKVFVHSIVLRPRNMNYSSP